MSSGFAGGLGEAVDDCEDVGYASGLSAGLAKAVADLDDADLMTASRGGFAAVPLSRVRDGATVVEHWIAAAEGVAFLDVRLPAGLAMLRHAGDRPEVVGLRLAAVRVGLVRKLLDDALARPAGQDSLLTYRLTLRAIADIVAAVESLRRQLLDMAWFPSRVDVVEVHRRLTRLDWQVARLFGQDGYQPTHPVRVLFVAELVANTWVGA